MTGSITLKAAWEKDSDQPGGGNTPEGDDEGNNKPSDGDEGEEPKKPESNDGDKSDKKDVIAKTGDETPFAGLFAVAASAGIAVLALRRRIA